MSDIVISVEHLSKLYTIRHGRNGDDGLRHAIHDLATAPVRWLRAKSKALRVSNTGTGSLPLPLTPLQSGLDASPLASDSSLLPLTSLPNSGNGATHKSNGTSASHSVPDPSHLPLAPLPREEEFWALRGVSFEVKRGEVVGIIGRNGAGKSTLLKILSQITEPTEGRVRIRGRVASLLEVGTGFHPELTGRENIFVNGAILGMSRAEIQKKFDEIVDFSGVEKFLDTPVKRYSSGMHVRLAFAVAAHLEPEILIIDEVLAVGDAEFQKRCLGKMNEVAKGGRTVLFVSHNMAAIEALCNRAMLLNEGQLVECATTPEVIRRYQRYVTGSDNAAARLIKHDRSPGAVAIMQTVTLKNDHGQSTTSFPMGASVFIEVEFDAPSPLSPVLGVVVKTDTGASIFGIDNRIVKGFQFDKVDHGRIVCQLDRLPLMPGQYSVDLYFGDQHSSLDWVEDAVSFSVVSANVFGTGRLPPRHCGSFVWPAKWRLEIETCSARETAGV
jgi:homopolymeric O-antigen transport system ATP-binding protein